jgi:hypothetical protein
MPPKTVVFDPLLASITPNTPTPTTSTMPRTQLDPNAAPRALATKPAPSTDGHRKGEKAPNWMIEEDKQLCDAWLNTIQGRNKFTKSTPILLWISTRNKRTEKHRNLYLFDQKMQLNVVGVTS